MKAFNKTEVKSILGLGLPIMVSQLGIVAMVVADTIQVGSIEQYGSESVAAAGFVSSIVVLSSIFGIVGIGVVAPMISKAVAEQDNRLVYSLFVTALRMGLLYATFTLCMVLIMLHFLSIFRQDPDVVALAKPFGCVMAVSIFPLFVFSAIRQLSDGLGKSRLAMYITIGAFVLNILLNWVLIHGAWFFPKWDLFGAGVATLVARVCMVFALWTLVRRDATCAVYLREKSSNLRALSRKVLSVGLPAGLQGFFEVAVFSGAAIIIGWYGKNQQAAHVIALNMCSIPYMMVTGFASAGGIRVGHYWGLKDKPGILAAAKATFWLAGGFMFVGALFFYVFRQPLVGLYTHDAAVAPIAVGLLTIGVFFQISDGLQVAALGVLRGMADVKVPTAITLFAYWVVGLPAGYVLGSHFGFYANGLWIGITLGLTVSAVLSWARFYRMAGHLAFGARP